ncbi:hypothetical protein BU23DRAFT_159032 [Bimuria novae-zelandiae CBS 107.79]|uniref:Uncharacterized protein n=1 Tax=Bimuria novae-zelandiae CBS 107.79 TaxID=1447943 RepID=A0A6A5V4T4_9PLEO|nr:hypothetical protein BU23DRAFT_159032 [Bimuria novae-zelandiae CBS 107.79]
MLSIVHRHRDSVKQKIAQIQEFEEQIKKYDKEFLAQKLGQKHGIERESARTGMPLVRFLKADAPPKDELQYCINSLGLVSREIEEMERLHMEMQGVLEGGETQPPPVKRAWDVPRERRLKDAEYARRKGGEERVEQEVVTPYVPWDHPRLSPGLERAPDDQRPTESAGPPSRFYETDEPAETQPIPSDLPQLSPGLQQALEEFQETLENAGPPIRWCASKDTTESEGPLIRLYPSHSMNESEGPPIRLYASKSTNESAGQPIRLYRMDMPERDEVAYYTDSVRRIDRKISLLTQEHREFMHEIRRQNKLPIGVALERVEPPYSEVTEPVADPTAMETVRQQNDGVLIRRLNTDIPGGFIAWLEQATDQSDYWISIYERDFNRDLATLLSRPLPFSRRVSILHRGNLPSALASAAYNIAVEVDTLTSAVHSILTLSVVSRRADAIATATAALASVLRSTLVASHANAAASTIYFLHLRVRWTLASTLVREEYILRGRGTGDTVRLRTLARLRAFRENLFIRGMTTWSKRAVHAWLEVLEMRNNFAAASKTLGNRAVGEGVGGVAEEGKVEDDGAGEEDGEGEGEVEITNWECAEGEEEGGVG